MAAITKFYAASRRPVTNLRARRMGLNLAQAASFDRGPIYLDVMKRFSQNCWDAAVGGGLSTPVALKSNKAPASSYNVTLIAGPLSVDDGAYSCGMKGTATSVTPSIVGGTVALSAWHYDSVADQTTFTITVTSAANDGAFNLNVTGPSSTSDLPRIVPASFNGVTYDPFVNATDFHPSFLKQLMLGTCGRAMDWTSTNASPDTDWGGSTAAGGVGDVRSMARSVSEAVRLCTFANIDLHVTAPPKATDDWLTNCSSTISGGLNMSLVVYFSFNEPWNPRLGNFPLHMAAALPLAGTFTGTAAWGNSITSVVRSGGVVTVNLTGACGTSGPFYMQGVGGITGGYIDVATKGLAVGTNSFTYNETGADVTGTLDTTGYTSYVNTNLSHYLVKAGVSRGTPQTVNSGVTPLYILYRYIIERMRSWWTIVQALPDAARFRFVLNTQPGEYNFNLRGYMLDRWGDDSWISDIQSAAYVQPANISAVTSVDDIFTQLTTALAVYPKSMLQAANGARSFRPVGSTIKRVSGIYEGGKSLAIHVNSTIAALIGSALRDDRMRVMMKTLFQMARDSGITGHFCVYKGGASSSFSANADNKTWEIAELTSGDTSGPQAQAMIEWGGESSVPQPVDGLTWGTINVVDVYGPNFGFSDTNGCRIVGTNSATGDLTLMITPPAPGTYNLALRFGSSAAGDWANVLVNDVELAHNAALVQVSGFTAPTVPFFNAAITLHGGDNELRIQPKGANRNGFLVLRDAVVG